MTELKKLIFIVFTSLLFSCGGSGDESGDSNTSLSDMSGVWDDTRDKESNSTDVEYIVIKSDGSRVDYDYQGDSWDNGNNCYEASNYSFLSLGDSLFELTFPDGDTMTLSASVSNNILTWSDNTDSISFPKIDLNESDFTSMLCACFSPGPDNFDIEIGQTCAINGENYRCLLDGTVVDPSGIVHIDTSDINGNNIMCN